MIYIPDDLWSHIKSFIFIPSYRYLKFFRIFVIPFLPKCVKFHEQFNIFNIESQFKLNYYFLTFKPFIYYKKKSIGPYLYRNISIKFSNYIIVSYSN